MDDKEEGQLNHLIAKINELKEERNRQDADYEELQHNFNFQVDAFRQQTSKFQELEKNYSAMIEENSYLHQVNKQIQAENDKLQQQNQQLQNQCNQLLEQTSNTKETLSKQQYSNQLLSQKVNNLQKEYQNVDESLNRVSKERSELKKVSRRYQEDMEISQDQIKRINEQIKEFVDRIPQLIQKDLPNITQTRLILEELQEGGDTIGLSQQIQANFEMFGQILTDSIFVFRKYSDIKQENRILIQKLSNLEKQSYSLNCEGEEWAQKETSVMIRLEQLQKEKAQTNKKLSEMMGELGAQESTFMVKQRQVNQLLTENEKLKNQLLSQQRLVEKMRSQGDLSYSQNGGVGGGVGEGKKMENELQLSISEKKKLEQIILQIVSKIQNQKLQDHILQILDHQREKESIQQQQIEYESSLQKHETDLKITVKTNPLREENIMLRKNMETIRLKYQKSAQAIRILEQQIDKEIGLIQRVEFLSQQKDNFDLKMQDVKEQLNELKNYAYS